MCVDHLSIQEVPGIYAITNIKNKKQYIGSSYNCRQRSYDHIAALKKNTHYSPHLQRSWNKYGEDSFTFVILACVFDINMLVEVEQLFLDNIKPYDTGYNCLKVAHSSLGYRHTDETKEKLRQVNLGKKHTKEAKQKMSMFQRGKTITDETKKRMSIAQIKAAETRDQTSHRTKEFREKMSNITKARARSKSKPFICHETEKVFHSTIDAENQIGISYKLIWRCLAGQRTKTHGMSFSYL